MTRSGRRLDARAREHRTPLDELARAGPGVPGAALGLVGLELQQVPAERHFETGEGGLDAVGGMPERCLAATGGGRLRLSPAPALEQAAEGERRRLAGAQLHDQPPRGQLAGRVADEDVRPGACSRSGAGKAGTSATCRLRQAYAS